MEMTLVGMYADTSPAWVSMMGRAVREPPPMLVGELRRPLQEPGVEVEDVPGVGLTTRRAPEDEGELPVRLACFERSS
jgi:hypothetical protein